MPMYRYRDEASGREIEVLRAFADYDQEPTEEELQADKRVEYAPPPEGGRKWTRLIGVAQVIKKYSGSKGYW